MELRDLKSYGEPGTVVYRVECVELMGLMPPESVDVVFADPPYRLSGGGMTVKSGRLVSVDKGGWDRPMGGRPYTLQRIFMQLTTWRGRSTDTRCSESARLASDQAGLCRMLDMDF